MLHVHAHPASQPSRSVFWACVITGQSFQLHADPSTPSSISPRGQLPAIVDDNFKLVEMPAILTYLAQKNSWHDLYPTNLQTRARISQYLHAHHNLTRLATLKLMAPHVLVVFGGLPSSNALSYASNTIIETAMNSATKLSDGQTLVEEVINFVAKHYLGSSDFVAQTAQASIADIACYEEISQLKWANLLDLSNWPSIAAWMARMTDLPHHDAIHSFNTTLGDIKTQPITMERFMGAIEVAMTDLVALPGVSIP
ncbi:MAG: hypothetical protein GXP16_16070 [Gammaproteobacteria bacterium]|nr:hypothetical protein [Gammaproteobacteria bacterium]